MSMQPGDEDFGAVCPYLGLADDADSHATYATEAHRCYRLPNPTRIATGHQETYCLGANHVNCPVYLGEGVPGAAAPAAAAAGAAAGGGLPRPTGNGGRAPQARPAAPSRPQRPGGSNGQQQQGTRPARRPNAGTIGPRPRAGGVSMPVATIGLFALALVVVALAFAVSKLVDNGGGTNALSPQDRLGTQTAQTAQAGGNATRPAGSATTTGQTPGATAGNQTPSAKTPTGSVTAPANGSTYTVVAGDFCGTIAEQHGITLQQLLTANNMVEADCNTLKIGQVLRLK